MTAIHAGAVDSAGPLDSTARKALAAATIGYAMDGFDLLILGFMLRAISADLHLTPAQAGSLVTWTLIGAVAGGILFGILSDYYGRVRVLTWTILLFAVFTGLGAMAQGYWDLLIYRTIAGLGLGGEFGIGMTLVAETWPARHRARGCAYVALGWQAGVLAGAGGGAGDAAAASGHRMARDVPGRPGARPHRLRGPLVCGRAEDISRPRRGRTRPR